ncbi:MAG TPA: flavodoxin family protein [Elusimicrobiales bacterium]|nr:flavodoxin family protein [Elusimicrobiales bacterium]
MKVLAINGSPHEKGCTYTALKLAAEELEKEGINTEIVHVGHAPLRGCKGCGACFKMDDPKCIFGEDIVNVCIEKSKSADGLIIGSPVHFSGIAGTMKCFLDRFFFAGGTARLQYKAGMSLVSLRRSGGVAAFQQLNNYLTFAKMAIPASQYWNVIHGTSPEETMRDAEGVQIMRVAGRNMAWLLKLIKNGAAIPPPAAEPRERTNFIR